MTRWQTDDYGPRESVSDLKTCTRCSRALPVSQFHRHVGRRDGRYSNCKDCDKLLRLSAGTPRVRTEADRLRRAQEPIPLTVGIRRAVGMPHGYFVDRRGNVYSMHHGRIKPMKQRPDRYGYMGVSARAPRHIRAPFYPYKVHVVMCLTFHGPKSPGQVVRHLDGTRTHNVPENLLWGTPLENQQDRHRHGRDSCGEKAYNARLTNTQAREIRLRYRRGESPMRLGKEYGISDTQVIRIGKDLSYREHLIAGSAS